MTDQDPTQRIDAPPPPADAPPPPPAIAPAPPPAPGTPVSATAAPTGPAPTNAGPAPQAPFPTYAPAEAVPAATATTPVAAAKRPGRSRAKWLVAGALTLVVAGTAAAATLLLTGDAGNPSVLAWTPKDSVAYTELRLDLPGDQKAELAEVMQAFPGFEDQAAFPTKINEALDQLVSEATEGEQTYTADIEPWFGGQLAVSIGALPSGADSESARALVLIGIKDAAKAQAWADELVREEGGTSATETYNGVTITTITPPEGGLQVGAKDFAAGYAIVGPVLALGDVPSIKAAIDTNGKTGLATDEQFAAASATLPGDRLAFAYIDNAALREGVQGLAGEMSSQLPELPGILDTWTAPWSAAAVRASDSTFVVESRAPHVEAAGPAKNAESKLPTLLPPTTVVLAEGHDVGEQILRIRDLLKEEPELAEGLKQVEDTLALIGGLEGVAGWIGEAGVAVTADGESVNGGLVVTPTDPAAAERLFSQIKAFIALGGGQAGLSATEEAYAGETITVLDLTGLGGLAGGAAGVPIPGDIPLKIAYVVTDDVVALGTPDFVKSVLDARAGESLAETARFAAALDQAGKSHSGLFWVDVKGLTGFVESQIAEQLPGDYEIAVKPYLQAFDSVIGTSVPGETIDNGTVIIRVSAD